MPGIAWGRADMLDTPAYWALRCQYEQDPLCGFVSESSLLEEIAFCLLGGFGIKAEINGAAFERLKAANVFDLKTHVSEEEIGFLLGTPLAVQGRQSRYRFPKQRAKRIYEMRTKLQGIELESLSVTEVVSLLADLNGIGPKTSAWIIRNHFGSDEVAILDVHVIRACRRLNLFPVTISLPRDYEYLQDLFISFSHAIDVRPAVLDAVMWNEMRSNANRVLRN